MPNKKRKPPIPKSSFQEVLPLRVPVREFTPEEREETINHLNQDGLRMPGRPRFICSVLGAALERTEDPITRELLIEAVWMGWRMAKEINRLKQG